MFKKILFATLLSFLVVGAFANESSASADNMAPMIEAVEDDTIGTQDTRTGNAGDAWVYLNRVRSLTSQASLGAKSKVGTMASISWTLTYSDGKSKTATNWPWSTSWSGTHVQTHSSSGTKAVTLSGFAVTTNGKVLYLLNPTASAYIY